jgi:hypothetical protein
MTAFLLLALSLSPAAAVPLDLAASAERFAALDGNKDGWLSAKEIVSGAAAEHKAMDLDGDGLLSSKDQPAGEAPSKPDPAQKPHPLDSGGDGKVSLLEFTRGAAARARLADGDSDGKITKAEWLADERRRLEHAMEEAELAHDRAVHEKPRAVKPASKPASKKR